MSLPVPSLSPNGSGLQQLLELEAMLQQRLVAVQVEAAQLVSKARDRAGAIGAKFREREAEAERELVARLAAEQIRERTALEEELARGEARYRSATPQRIEAIARQLLTSLLDSP